MGIPDDLPREDIIHDIPEADKICPHDGHTLKVIGSDDHEQLDIIPAQIYEYLKHVFTRLPNMTTKDSLEDMMPWSCEIG